MTQCTPLWRATSPSWREDTGQYFLPRQGQGRAGHALPGRRHGVRHLGRVGRRPAGGGAAEASAGGVTAAGVHAAPVEELHVIGSFRESGWLETLSFSGLHVCLHYRNVKS